MTRMSSICLNMIVRDEQEIIRGTLDNILKYFDISTWVICDTGSRDKTKEEVSDFFARRGIPGELHADDWWDFSHNRNLALERASAKADYTLLWDADDRICGELVLPSVLDANAYALKFGSEFSYFRPMLISNALPWSWRGVLHEFITRSDGAPYFPVEVHGDYHIDFSTFRGSGFRNRQSDKYRKDAWTLSQAYESEKDPELANRYAFYCAQSYRDAGDIDNAIAWYKKRAKRGGWTEEVYDSYLNVGKLLKKRGDKQLAVTYFLEAQNACSSRAEGYYELAKLFREQKKHRVALDMAKIAKGIPKPSSALFLQNSVYDYQIDFEIGISAFYAGEHDLGLASCEAVLKSGYDNAEVRKAAENIEFYKKEKAL